MLLERTIFQLDIGYVPPDEANRLGQLGYLQWLGALPGNACYPREAMHAYEAARPFIRTSPAIAAFCELLIASADSPVQPLALRVPERSRRGGAQARRLSL